MTVVPGYKPRMVDRELAAKLEAVGAILIEGPRGCASTRFGHIRMRPMSLVESGHSSGRLSLAGLFAGNAQPTADPGLDIHALAERTAIGGWPTLVDGTPAQAMTALRGYLDDVSRVDLQLQRERLAHRAGNGHLSLRAEPRTDFHDFAPYTPPDVRVAGGPVLTS